MELLELKRMNLHQTHFEDLVLLGVDGINEIDDKLNSFLNFIKNKKDLGYNYTTKIDGSPAVICYSKFTGYPDNSICLKSFINNANNVLSSEEEIQKKYGDRPSMYEKLVYCLQLAKLIPEGEAWQGDCLFSQDDKKEEIINGKKYITFQPNKIVYAFSEDNDGYNNIKNSEFGIAFHTVYKDIGNGEKSQSFRPEIDKINWPKWCYILSPFLDLKSDNFDIKNIEKCYEDFEIAKNKILENTDLYENLVNNEVFIKYWNTFENSNIADKKLLYLNPKTLIEDLKDYIAEKQTKEFQKKYLKLSTNAGKMRAIDSWANDVATLKDIIEYNKEIIIDLCNLLNKATSIKMSLWSGFKKSKQNYDTFYISKSRGIIDASMEGVSMSDPEGNIVKIVDRTEFSSNNRNPDILAGWEHNDILNEMMLNNQRDIHSGIGFLKLDMSDKGLPYGKYKYVDKFISAMKTALESKEDISFMIKDKSVKKQILDLVLTPEDLSNILISEDTEEFCNNFINYIKKEYPTASHIQKPKNISEKSKDISMSIDLQEAIQAYIIKNFWNFEYNLTDEEFVDVLFSEDFENLINWRKAGDYDFYSFKEDIKNTLNSKGQARSGTWLKYFITLAKESCKKIKDLFSGPESLTAKAIINNVPEVYARGLISDGLDGYVNDYFSKSILGKAKDLVNKADILLDFNNKADEFFSKVLSASTIEEYCRTVDDYLITGEIIGISLKKGSDVLHVELIETVTPTNKLIFGENASASIRYYGEHDKRNTFKSLNDILNDKNNFNNISTFNGHYSISSETKEDIKTCSIKLPLNDDSDMKEVFGDFVECIIRSNNTQGTNATVEMKSGRKGTKAFLGKVVTTLCNLTDEVTSKGNNIDKINKFLFMFEKMSKMDKPDLNLALLVSSLGYPLMTSEDSDGESVLVTAPVVKIS